MSTLQKAALDYVAMRRGLGYKYVHQEYRLLNFVTFMAHRDATIVTTKLALEWAMLPSGKHATWAIRIADVRGFARYLQGFEPSTEIPPTGIITYRSRLRPYIYTEVEIEKLLAAALTLPPVQGLRRWTDHYLFGLLAVTGLRISEALALK